MHWIGKLSLRHKLTLVIMINTVVALCTAGIGFAEYGVYRFKELRLEDLNALANILGTNSTAPLAFKDPDSAQDILKALAAKPHILSAVIYDRDGKAVVTLDTPLGKANAWAEDVTIEDKPNKTTILSGG